MEPSQYPDYRVCAVVVTYHPTQQMIDNFAAILAQTQSLVVVDNGSDLATIQKIKDASQRLSFHLIENATNLGLAEALNQGVRAAKMNGFPWIILFDQDSRITPNFIEKMFASWNSHPNRNRIGAMHPKYIDPVTGIEPNVFRAPDGGPITSMTSGALMPTWIFDKIGLFPSEYFIDQIDTEYGYRIRSAGYLNTDSREAVLLHSAGQPRRIHFLGFSFEPTYHSATRRYYFTRNRIVVYRKYFRAFPRFVSHAMYIAFRETIKCFIAEPDRLRKFRNTLLGSWDAFTGKMGKREGL